MNDRDVVVVSGSRRVGLWFALPWLVGMVGLTIVPVTASMLISLSKWDGLSLTGGFTWAGGGNYAELVGFDDDGPRDPLFYRSLGNSLYYTLLAVPLGLVTSLLLAMLLNRRPPGMGVFRIAFLLPYLLSGVATIMIWSWLFNPRFGLVNRGIVALYRRLDPAVRLFDEAGTSQWGAPDWFYSPTACKPALILMHVWLGGGAMLIFLAALQRVPHSLAEAAALDGAGRWARFRHVTLPHISPAVVFNLVVGLIFAMQSFDQAYLLYNRAQDDGLLFYMLRLYRAAFEPPYAVGYASAMAWILFGVIAVMVGPVLVAARRWVHDEIKR